MPKIDPTAYLLQAISTLTGGLINDLTSVILGLVVCAFILMGLDYLVMLLSSFLGGIRNDRQISKYFAAAQDVKNGRDSHSKGSDEWMTEDYLYKSLLKKTARARMEKIERGKW